MRTLSSALLAAQKSPAREPYVEVKVENSRLGVRRLNFNLLDTTAQNMNKHGIAVAGDGSVNRIRLASVAPAGGDLMRQRITTGTGWGSGWSQLVADASCGVVCAIAAAGARVAVAYTDPAGTGIKLKESTDNGATFGSEQAVVTAGGAATAIAIAYKNTSGDLAIAWTRGTTVDIIKRTGGSFGSVASNATGQASLTGLAMCYGFDWDMLLTGTAVTTTKPTLWSLAYGDGNDLAAGTWGSLYAQAQADSTANVTFSKPFLAYTDTYRGTFMENDAFTGGANRCYHIHAHPSLIFGAPGAFSLFVPGPVHASNSGTPTGYSGSEGLAIAAGAGGTGSTYLSGPDFIASVRHDQAITDVTARVLALDIHEEPLDSWGTIDLDNSDGFFSNNGDDPTDPLSPGNLVAVAPGYRTTSGNVGSRMQDFWVAAVAYDRVGGRSVFRLHVEGAWRQLARFRARTAVQHTTDTYAAIMLLACFRAGLLLSTSGNSSRSTTVTPPFAVPTTMTSHEAVRRALQYLPDRIVAKPLAGLQLTEPLAAEASDYTFGTDHPLLAVTLQLPAERVSVVHALGNGAFGEAFDLPAASQSLGQLAQLRDLASSTGAAAAATAAAALRQLELDTPAGELTVPPHVGLELLDVVTINDPLINGADVVRRVRGLRWRYDRRRPSTLYEQTVTLGPR